MQPEPVAPGFLTTERSGVGRSPKVALGAGNLPHQRFLISPRDLADPGCVAESSGKAELPGLQAKLKREQQGWLLCVRLLSVGRCCSLRLFPP